MRILSALPVFSALVFLSLSSSAFAQFSNTSNAPITIDADDSSLERGSAVFSGQVDARQGDVRILTDKMTITGRQGGGINAAVSDIDTIIAVGNFYYITPTQEVRGQRGVYRQASNDFTVTGNVVLLQDDSVVTGDTLIYNLETEEARMVSDCKGRKCGLSQRVRVLIQNTNQNGAKG